MKEPKDFTEDEIGKLTNPMMKIVTLSNLSNETLKTYNIKNEITLEVFLLTYKSMYNLASLLEEGKTREKLMENLNELKEPYLELERLKNVLDNTICNRVDITLKINTLLNEYHFQIHNLLHLLGLFSGSQAKIDINKTIGVRMDTPEGQAVIKKIREELK